MTTKLRTHAHFLAAERDNTKRIKLTVKFLCKKCDKITKEDVDHWLFDCTCSQIFNQPRANLLNTITRFLGYLSNDQELICKLMNCGFYKPPTKQTELLYKLTYLKYNIREKQDN